MIEMTPAQLRAHAAALDEERRQLAAQLAALDRHLPRLEQALESARRTDAEYERQYGQISAELGAVTAEHGARVVDNPGFVSVVSGGRHEVPLAAERRIIELCRERRRLEAEREAFLKAGGTTAASAWHRLDRARIDRAVLGARLGEPEGR